MVPSKYEDNQSMSKPPRPLGLSLALLSSVFLFSCIPLFLFVYNLQVQEYFRNRDFGITSPDGAPVEPFFAGSDSSLYDTEQFVPQAVFSAFFLVLAWFAWRGRPAWTRGAIVLAIVALMLYHAVDILIPLLSPPGPTLAFDSGEGVGVSLQWGRLLLTLLIPLYSIWYMNRGPARAFYRGYYLPEPDTEPSAAHR